MDSAMPNDIREFYKQIQPEVEEAVLYLDAKIATDVQDKIEKALAVEFDLKTRDKRLFSEINLLLAKVKFVRFPSLGDEESLELINQYILVSPL